MGLTNGNLCKLVMLLEVLVDEGLLVLRFLQQLGGELDS